MLIEYIRHILKRAIKDTPFEQVTYFAGGCVRDFLLRRAYTDFDLAVEMDEGGVLLAEHLYQAGVCSKPVFYKQFGTALIILDGHKIEMVMTRSESYRRNSRKPKVKDASLYEDTMRRDFTVNSLMMRVSDREILDLSGLGLDDLKNGIIRATSDPTVIFREDPLRLIRAVRFAATPGFEIEPKTLRSIKALAYEIKFISVERTGEEFERIMRSDTWVDGILLLKKSNLWENIKGITFIKREGFLINNRQLTSEQLCRMSALSVWGRYWALYGSAWGIDRHLESFHCSLTVRKKFTAYGKAMELLCDYYSSGMLTELDINKFLHNFKPHLQEIFEQFILLKQAGLPCDNDGISPVDFIDLFKTRAIIRDQKRFCLTGDVLLRSFCLNSSPFVGELLKEAMEYWFSHPGAGKKELLNHLKDLHPELVYTDR